MVLCAIWPKHPQVQSTTAPILQGTGSGPKIITKWLYCGESTYGLIIWDIRWPQGVLSGCNYITRCITPFTILDRGPKVIKLN